MGHGSRAAVWYGAAAVLVATGGCAVHPAPLPVTGRVWATSDGRAPREVTAAGDSALWRAGGAITRPRDRWLPAEPVRAIAPVEWRRVGAGLPALREPVPIRQLIWPGPARVTQHDTAGVRIETRPTALSAAAAELRCATTTGRSPSARLAATLAPSRRGGTALRVEWVVAGAEGCHASDRGRDRATAWLHDLHGMAWRAARRTHAVPLRP